MIDHRGGSTGSGEDWMVGMPSKARKNLILEIEKMSIMMHLMITEKKGRQL